MSAAPAGIEIAPPTARPVVIATADNKVYQFPNLETAADFEDRVREVGGTTLRLLPLAAARPEATRSLYDVEDHLAAMADTAEMVSLDEEQSFLAEFQTVLTAAAEKRDRVGQFFAHCESQVTLAHQEIDRLKKRKGFYQRAIERMEGYVTMVIVSLGPDAKGKLKRLEGNTSTFRVQRNPSTVAIENDAAVPKKYKAATVTLPAEIWEAVVDAVPLELRAQVLDAVKRAEVTISKTALNAAIAEAVPTWKDLLKEQNAICTEAVPGAAIMAGSLRLVRE
jgi:hypothetical protein